MSPPKAKAKAKAAEVVKHIHPLTKVDGVGTYICDGCKTEGLGRTYRCASCNFDLHEYCATCPPTLLSIFHPQHELRLVRNRRGCDICHETTNGLFYQCKLCDFDVHPLCTQQQPQKVNSNTDQGEVQEPREAEQVPDPDRTRKRDVMYIGARVALACMMGDVSGVISALF